MCKETAFRASPGRISWLLPAEDSLPKPLSNIYQEVIVMDKQLYEERISLFKDAAHQVGAKRIPILSNVYSWMIHDSGYKLTEALYDYDKLAECHYNLQERYGFDTYLDMSIRNPVKVTEILGASNYVIDDDSGLISVHDACLMEPDEYPAYGENMMKFFWEKCMPRKFPLLLAENNRELFQKTAKEYYECMQYVAKLRQTFRDKYSVPMLLPSGDTMHNDNAMLPSASPLGLLYNFLRGMKNFSIDMRRRTKDIDRLYELNYQTQYLPALEALKNQPAGSDPNGCFDYSGAFLVENFLSIKQFEKYQWPCMKETIDVIAAQGKTLYPFVEGSMARYADYISDIPKGCVTMHLEHDNIFEMKKRFPNITFAGGMPTALLGNGTKEECVDYAKKLLDEVGYDGNFIFSQDKMVSYRNDCKAENLRAVNDYVRSQNVR